MCNVYYYSAINERGVCMRTVFVVGGSVSIGRDVING